MPDPTDAAPPQLFQVIGTVLRDIAQARFMSDLYSRQISYTYEGDALLRRFPVPRVEIEKVEFELKLAVNEVRPDEKRKSSRNAAVGRLLDSYSAGIMRFLVTQVQKHLAEKATDDERSKLVATFEKKFLSDDRLDVLRGRLLRYLNENIGDLMTGDSFNEAMAEAQVHDNFIAFGKEPDVLAAITALQVEWDGLWDQLSGAGNAPSDETVIKEDSVRNYLRKLARDIEGAWSRYPDFSVHVEVSAGLLKELKDTLISSVKVTAAVKNYRWSKVDVDSKDMRNIRTLNPE